MTSTLSTSNHWRAMLDPIGLVLVVGHQDSTFRPFFAAPKSSTAMRAATTEPGPASRRSARLVVHYANLDHAIGNLAWAAPTASASAAARSSLFSGHGGSPFPG